MSDNAVKASETIEKPRSDYLKFWVGQTLSNLGSSITLFALPLMIFKLTNSAVDLSLVTVVSFLPYLLFGLIIGAWVDRVDRKRLMIWTDLIRACVIAIIPLLAFLHQVSIWWIYVVAFTNTTMMIFFNAAQFAAIPSLVKREDLVKANGQIQASYSLASVAGPLLAGLLVVIISAPMLLLFDALSFLISALSLVIIRVSFNQGAKKRPSVSVRQDIVDGVLYVVRHPVLRSISIITALTNFVSITLLAQIVLYAKEVFRATDTQASFFYTSASIGVVVCSLSASRLRKRWSFSTVALGAILIYGALIVVFSLMHVYIVALILWALISGFSVLFNINATSLRQTIVPNHLLGRVITVASVLGWSAIPLGSWIGGLLIEKGKNVSLVYGGIGIVMFIIAVVFLFTALRNAEAYLIKTGVDQEQTTIKP